MAGFGHLWFITEILICVLLTPLMNATFKLIPGSNKTVWVITLFLFVFLVQPSLVTIGINLSYIISYFIGFLISRWETRINRNHLIAAFLCCLTISIVRLVCKRFIDGSVLYDRYIALISQGVLALFLFVLVFYLGEKFHKFFETIFVNRIVIYLSSLTYGVYLTHYFFLRGPWPVINIIPNRVLADIVVVILSFLLAGVLESVVTKIKIS